MKPANSLSSTRPNRRSLDYQTLESRQLLASFTGTDAVDQVTVFYSGGQPTSIEINGETFANSDATISLQLPANADFNAADEVSLVGDTFDLVIDQLRTNTQVQGNAGSLMIQAASGLSITTSEGNDQVDIHHTFGEDNYRYAPSVNLDLGAGDDRIRYDRSTNGNWYLGEGNDYLIDTEGGQLLATFVDMGAGEDRWLLKSHVYDRTGPGVYLIGEGDSSPLLSRSGQFDTGANNSVDNVEWAINLSDSKASFGSLQWLYQEGNGNSAWRLDVMGNTTWFSESTQGHTLGLLGFDDFSGNYNFRQGSLTSGLINIRHSETTIQAEAFSEVVVGGNVSAGDTSNIAGVDLGWNRKLVVSNSSQTSNQNVRVDRAAWPEDSPSLVIYGLTDESFYFTGAELVLMGGQGDDSFSVFNSIANSRITLYGNAGDDQFTFPNGNLDALAGVVNAIGGSGSDSLSLMDYRSTGNFAYLINEHWVFNSPDIHSPGERAFAGIWFDKIENAYLVGNPDSNRFRVTPSLTTAWSIAGNLSSFGEDAEDRIILRGPYSNSPVKVELDQGRGSFWFGAGKELDELFEKLVYFDEMEFEFVVG